MRDNSVLSQFTSRVAPSHSRGEPKPELDSDRDENLGAFGWLRGARDRALMLELRRRDGSAVAFGYSWLERIDFDAASGMTLTFGRQVVRIQGRNLNAESRPNVRLLDGLCRHRVPWIQEADEPTSLRADPIATVIERIEVS